MSERDNSRGTSGSYVVETSCGLDDLSMDTDMTELESYVVE